MSMNTERFRITIFHKILIGILIVNVLPLAGLWYINNFKFQKELEQKVEDGLRQAAELLSSQVNDWTDMSLRLLRQNSSLADMQSGEELKQRPILHSIVNSYDWIYLAYTIKEDGFMMARSDRDGDIPILKPDGSKAHYRGDRGYYKQILMGDAVGQQVLISRTLGKPAFILCSPVQNPNEGRNTNALCIAMTTVDMSDAVAKVEFGRTGYAILLDDTNKVIANGKAALLTDKLQDFTDNPLVKKKEYNKSYIYIDENGVKKIAYSKKAGRDWRLIVTQEYDDAFSSLIDAKQKALIFLVVTIVASILVALMMAKRLASPIQKLTVIADDISRGKFHTKLEQSSRSDEIGDLSKAIERMGISIFLAFKKLKNKK